MVTPRKAEPSQRGRKGDKSPFYQIDITKPPAHFDAKHRELWQATVRFPGFMPTHDNFTELAAALNYHMAYCKLSAEIEAMQRNGREPDQRMQQAADAARRPYF
jgi:hypothetical protein